jgi:hypothetical protein
MQPIVLGREEYQDRVLACWLGKNIGGTLGAPMEGQRKTHALAYFEPVPRKAAPNDGLDLQLVWLKLLEDRGLNPSVADLAEYWSRYAASYPWNEYGSFMRNYARERVESRFGHLQPCNAVPNHGFTIIGWLYGKGFGDCLCKAVNCGYDTDCTGATLGSLLGILGGTAAIPSRWRKPVGEEVVLHPFTRNFTPPATVQELTARTAALAEKVGDRGRTMIICAIFNALPAGEWRI